MSYLKTLPIAVLGGGAVGKTCAADCKLAGREVRLYSRSKQSIDGLEKTGILLDGIQRNLFGFERSGRAFMDIVSTDMAKVVKGAGLIVIGIPAHAHEYYLKTLVHVFYPYLSSFIGCFLYYPTFLLDFLHHSDRHQCIL